MSLVGRMGERGSAAFYREREVDEGSARGERDDRSLQWGAVGLHGATDGVGFLLIMGRNGRGSNGRVHAPLTTSNRRVINGRADLSLHRAGVVAAGSVRSRPLRRASGLGGTLGQRLERALHRAAGQRRGRLGLGARSRPACTGKQRCGARQAGAVQGAWVQGRARSALAAVRA
jgi:hypothetical protein